MIVGVDFRALQVGHQFRGIGEVTRQVTSWLAANGQDVEIVGYVEHGGPKVDLSFLNVVPKIVTVPRSPHGRLRKLANIGGVAEWAKIRDTCDVFLQFDFELGLPPHHPSVLVVHDQIPYILGNKYPHTYLPDYVSARRSGMDRKLAFKKATLRRAYQRNLKKALARANASVTVSAYTAQTTRDYVPVSDHDTKVIPSVLGFDPGHHQQNQPVLLEQARLEYFGLDKNSFLFFMGGVDERRRVDELVAAFNLLRAEGHDLKLVLAGYDFQSIDTIYNPMAAKALRESSYLEDICFMGFVSDRERSWLYSNALAYVFPTEFEGFGLPILEALAIGCPVIVYNNSAIPEVAGPNSILVDGWQDIKQAANNLMARSAADSKKERQAGIEWAHTFAWSNFSGTVLEQLRLAVKK